MRTTWTIVVIVIALLLLYLAYRYFLAPKPEVAVIPVIPRPRTVSVQPVVLEVDKCAVLESLKAKIAQYFKDLDAANTNLILGYKPSRAGNITDPEVLKNDFETANYNYNNEIINYNGVAELNKCNYEKIIPSNVYTTKARVIPGVVDTTFDCAGLGYRQALSILQINMQRLDTQYQIAAINLQQYDVQENREKSERLKNELEKARIKYEDYFNKCNKK